MYVTGLCTVWLASCQHGHFVRVKRLKGRYAKRQEREGFAGMTVWTAAQDDEDQSALRLAAQGNAALCTLVGIEGSFSRRLGAQVAIGHDGAIAGSLADGCLEQELASQARLARQEGKSCLLRFGRGSPFLDFRLPCGSGVDILIDPAPDQAVLAGAVAALDARRAATIDLPHDRSDLLCQRQYIPGPRLVVFGKGPEAEALTEMARHYRLAAAHLRPGDGLFLGQRPTEVTADRWTALVLLFHDHEWEREIVTWALGTPAFYIGALGGKVTRDTRRELLAQAGFPQEQIARVTSPIGLIPHTRESRSLALSVLAEVIARYEDLRALPE